MNYESADYMLANQVGDERGPYHGKAETKLAAIRWQNECDQAISVYVRGTREMVASLWPEGDWMLPDRRDSEGNHLPRMEW